MLNSVSNNTKIKINAVSGTLVKNCEKSFFYICNTKGPDANRLFDSEEPNIKMGYKFVKVVVLQTMVIDDGMLLSEVVRKEDFDKMFVDKEDNQDVKINHAGQLG